MIRRANIVDHWEWKELVAAYDRLYTPGTKTAVFYAEAMYPVVPTELNRTEPPKLLEERFMLESLVILMPPLHFLSDMFDRQLQKYIEAGMIDCYTKRWLNKYNPARFKEFKLPFATLTLDELEAGFVVFLVPLALSILAFVIELMPTLKNLLVFSSIFRKYFKVKESEQRLHSQLMKAKIEAFRGFKSSSPKSNNELAHQDTGIDPEAPS